MKKREEKQIKSTYNEQEGHFPLFVGEFRWHFKHLTDQK